jgi:hypothetical protein
MLVVAAGKWRSGALPPAFAVLAAFVLLVLAPGVAEAGSIIMKNGYIIQGPIVERSELAIVMGWPNGKLTVYRRFIENINYESGEEKRLQEDEQFRAQEKAPQEEDLTLLASGSEPEELPPTLEELMRKYEGIARAGGQVGDAGASGQEPEVRGVLRPEEMLGDRLNDGNVAVALNPPRGWALKKNKEFLELAGEAEPDGFRPSINIVLISKAPLSTSDYVSLLKEEDARTIEGFELLSEGHREIGALKAYEIVGRGSYQGREAVVRQVLVPKGQRLWLVSGFTRDHNTGGAFSIIDESLKTFDFTAE